MLQHVMWVLYSKYAQKCDQRGQSISIMRMKIDHADIWNNIGAMDQILHS